MFKMKIGGNKRLIVMMISLKYENVIEFCESQSVGTAIFGVKLTLNAKIEGIFGTIIK